MAHKLGDLVEIVTDEEGNTVPALVTNYEDDKGEAVGVMILRANAYASDGNHIGGIKTGKKKNEDKDDAYTHESLDKIAADKNVADYPKSGTKDAKIDALKKAGAL